MPADLLWPARSVCSSEEGLLSMMLWRHHGVLELSRLLAPSDGALCSSGGTET